jgi:hypothetical protein
MNGGPERVCDGSGAGSQADADAGAFLDCVGVLQVQRVRGILVANARRFGGANAAWRTASRLSDLAGPELRDFCDWEACIRTNGYRHACYLNDAGWERCRVCDGGGDCDGLPMSQDDCVAHATDVGRATCHVGLLEECLLQQAVRGPADPRVTQTCALSKQACEGILPGDLSSQALAARHETDQVEVQEAMEEAARANAVEMKGGAVCQGWEGGVPVDVTDAAADAATSGLDAGARD